MSFCQDNLKLVLKSDQETSLIESIEQQGQQQNWNVESANGLRKSNDGSGGPAGGGNEIIGFESDKNRNYIRIKLYSHGEVEEIKLSKHLKIKVSEYLFLEHNKSNNESKKYY